MTFPNIPEDTLELAAQVLAGDAPSRAAMFSAGQQIKHVVRAIQLAHTMSANCDICGHFHALTEHPANAHSEETTPAPDEKWRTAEGRQRLAEGVGVSYAAVPKLERESGGDKSGTWDSGDENGPWMHDHDMCDPDRDCGPDNAAPDDAAPGHHWARQVFVGGNRAGKTSAQQQRLMAWTDAEMGRLATSPLPGPRRLAESFFKDTSPAAEAERAAMQRLNAAAELREAFRVTTEEVRASQFFAGGKIWSDSTIPPGVLSHTSSGPWPAEQEAAGLQRLMRDIEAEPGGIDQNEGDWDCEHTRPTADAEGAVLDAEGMDPAYPRTSPEDKLRILADIVDNQSPQGTELADFRRRLSIILGMQ